MSWKRSIFLAMALCATIGCGEDASSDADESSDQSVDNSDVKKSDAGKGAGKDAGKDAGKGDDDDDADDEGADDEGADDEGADDEGAPDAGKADAGKDPGKSDAGKDPGKADAGSGGGGGDCADLTYEAFGKPFLDKYCASCHAASAKDREDAPKSAVYDTLDQVKKVKVALGVYVVTGKLMPPASYKAQPTAAERTQFKAWLDCGPN